MIKVYQDAFGELGNCLSAALASIFEIPLRDVPNFAVINQGPDGKPTGKWYGACFNFCKARGFELWFRYRAADGTIPTIEGAYPFHLIGGTSPRGFSHAVVGYKGKMIHDPHPEGGGVDPIDDYGFLVPVKPTEGLEP